MEFVQGDEDDFQPDVYERPPTPPTNPVYRERRQNTAERPKEGFPWDLRETWHSYRVYISTTHEDMLSELRLLYEEIVPALQERARARRIKIVLIYLQDGLSAKEVHRCSVALRLREMERCNNILILQGRTYGDVPEDEHMDRDAAQFEWLRFYPRGRSFQVCASYV